MLRVFNHIDMHIVLWICIFSVLDVLILVACFALLWGMNLHILCINILMVAPTRLYMHTFVLRYFIQNPCQGDKLHFILYVLGEELISPNPWWVLTKYCLFITSQWWYITHMQTHNNPFLTKPCKVINWWCPNWPFVGWTFCQYKRYDGANS